MNMETVRFIIKKEVQRMGYDIDERKSTTSDSWYYTISNGTESLMFRISDHRTRSNVVTFRIDKTTKQIQLVRFIHNRCEGLSKRTLKKALGI